VEKRHHLARPRAYQVVYRMNNRPYDRSIIMVLAPTRTLITNSSLASMLIWWV
jgi:hypothetical protein